MAEITLLRIQNPRAFLVPDLNAFVLRALGTSPMVDDPAAALLELVDYVEDARAGVFVVRHGADYVGLALAECSGSAFAPGCNVLHFYNAGPPEARKRLVDAIAGFAREHGTLRIWGVDINQRPKGFVKLFEALGPATLRGHLYELDLSEGTA